MGDISIDNYRGYVRIAASKLDSAVQLCDDLEVANELSAIEERLDVLASQTKSAHPFRDGMDGKGGGVGEDEVGKVVSRLQVDLQKAVEGMALGRMTTVETGIAIEEHIRDVLSAVLFLPAAGFKVKGHFVGPVWTLDEFTYQPPRFAHTIDVVEVTAKIS